MDDLFSSCLRQQPPLNVRNYQFSGQFCLGTGWASLCLYSVVYVFSQFSAHACQIKSAYINKRGRKWYLQFFHEANTNLLACTKSKHITHSFSCFCLTAQTIRDTSAALSDAVASQKAKEKPHGFLFHQQSSNFLGFFLPKKKKKVQGNKPSPSSSPDLLLLLLSITPTNNKMPSVFSWASSPARQKDFRT